MLLEMQHDAHTHTHTQSSAHDAAFKPFLLPGADASPLVLRPLAAWIRTVRTEVSVRREAAGDSCKKTLSAGATRPVKTKGRTSQIPPH